MNYKKVKHIVIKRGMKASDLVSEMNESGVMGAGKIGRAADIIDNMIKDKGCKVFFWISRCNGSWRYEGYNY